MGQAGGERTTKGKELTSYQSECSVVADQNHRKLCLQSVDEWMDVADSGQIC